MTPKCRREIQKKLREPVDTSKNIHLPTMTEIQIEMKYHLLSIRLVKIGRWLTSNVGERV